MIFLKYFIQSLSFIASTVDNFTKPSSIFFTIIDSNIMSLYNFLYLFFKTEGVLSVFKFIKENTIFKNEYIFLFLKENTSVLIKPMHINLYLNSFFFKGLYGLFNFYLSKYGVVTAQIVFNSTFFLFFSIFFFNFFIKIQRKLTHSFFIVQKFSKEHDQEITSYEDFLIFVVFFISFFINIFNLATTQELINANYYMALWFLFFFFFSLVVVVPASILFSAGSNFLLYLKGVEKLNTLFGYLIADAIAILAFFLRFFLQIIRWCLFLTTYYLLHEFIFEWAYNLFLNLINNNILLNSIFFKINNNILVQMLLHFFRFVFELFDTCLILVIQITAFVAVILWLFNFLFSLSMDDLYETKNINK